MVKRLFNDHEFRDGMKVTGVNSINWARIMAQIVYYFTAAVALGSPNRLLSFAVPTGNFGDVFAGFVAHKMGLPIKTLAVATNVNDILVRTLETGTYKPDGVTATYSPSMDIQVSSNFERLMFEMAGRDANRIASLMNDLSEKGEFQLSENELAPMRDLFVGLRINEDETVSRIKAEYEDNHYIIDPHSAIALEAGARCLKGNEDTPMIALATAHPAKFPDVVATATGTDVPQPARLIAQLKSEERVTRLPNDLAEVSQFIGDKTRAGKVA
jgi:threonine synthase